MTRTSGIPAMSYRRRSSTPCVGCSTPKHRMLWKDPLDEHKGPQQMKPFNSDLLWLYDLKPWPSAIRQALKSLAKKVPAA